MARGSAARERSPFAPASTRRRCARRPARPREGGGHGHSYRASRRGCDALVLRQPRRSGRDRVPHVDPGSRRGTRCGTHSTGHGRVEGRRRFRRRAAGLQEMRSRYPGLYQSLLADRNHAWVGRIDTMLNHPGSVFVLVGDSHLPGDDGIPSLLARSGTQARDTARDGQLRELSRQGLRPRAASFRRPSTPERDQRQGSPAHEPGTAKAARSSLGSWTLICENGNATLTLVVTTSAFGFRFRFRFRRVTNVGPAMPCTSSVTLHRRIASHRRAGFHRRAQTAPACDLSRWWLPHQFHETSSTETVGTDLSGPDAKCASFNQR